MKLLEEPKIIEAVSAVMTAQERSERSLSYMDITAFEDGAIGTGVKRMVEQIGVCVREISELLATLRESDDPVPPQMPAGAFGDSGSGDMDLSALDDTARKELEAAQERYWQERMRLVHAVERCALRVDAARAQGDVAFMDGIMEIRESGFDVEEQAALTDIYLSLKDVYDAASEASEVLRLRIARGEG